MDFSCSGLLTGAISCKAGTKLCSKLWCFSAEQGKGCAWHRRTHFMLLIRSRALVTEEGAGSSNGNSATGPASTPVWNHWALSADRFPWSDMLWSDSFAQQSPGWLQHTLLCSLHLWTGFVADCMSCLITSLLWLPLVWMNTHTHFLPEIFW